MDQGVSVSVTLDGAALQRGQSPEEKADDNKGSFCLPGLLTLPVSPFVLVSPARTIARRGMERHDEKPAPG